MYLETIQETCHTFYACFLVIFHSWTMLLLRTFVSFLVFSGRKNILWTSNSSSQKQTQDNERRIIEPNFLFFMSLSIPERHILLWWLMPLWVVSTHWVVSWSLSLESFNLILFVYAVQWTCIYSIYFYTSFN